MGQTKLNRHMAAIAASAALQIARREERVDYILLLAQWARQWQTTPSGSVEIGHLTLLGYIIEFAQPRTLLTLQRVFAHVDLGQPQSWPAPNSDANDHHCKVLRRIRGLSPSKVAEAVRTWYVTSSNQAADDTRSERRTRVAQATPAVA